MTPEQIALVERTFLLARPQLDSVVATFYERLFAADPTAAAMFTTDEATQRSRFAAELEVIASSIRRHGDFVAEVRELGARHDAYGVRAEHYQLVGPLLLEALADALGDTWTDEVGHAWQLAYRLTAETMMAGAAGQL